MKATDYFRDVVRRKHPGIEEAWILRVLDEPLEERQQADGRYVLWGLVPEAQNRALRVVTLRRERPFTTPSLIAAFSGESADPRTLRHPLRHPRDEDPLFPRHGHPLYRPC